jgi:DNA-binding response OmpR family regulator
MSKILLIDDEKIYADPLIVSAKENHLDIHWEVTGLGGLDYLANHHKDINLLILDMVLPDMTGTEIQKKVLSKYPYIPIIIVTTRKLSEVNESVGLELGAEEYYDKNKGINILIIKIKKILERYQSGNSLKKNKTENLLTLIYSKETEQFFLNDKLLTLPGKQHNILLSLYKNPNKVLSDERLRLEANLAPTAEVKGYITKIRKVLKNAGLSQPQNLIKTEVKRGYRYSP